MEKATTVCLCRCLRPQGLHLLGCCVADFIAVIANWVIGRGQSILLISEHIIIIIIGINLMFRLALSLTKRCRAT